MTVTIIGVWIFLKGETTGRTGPVRRKMVSFRNLVPSKAVTTMMNILGQNLTGGWRIHLVTYGWC